MAAVGRRSPVLIVGGGPVGLFASATLSRLRVRSILVEKHTTPSNHPRAHLLNTRTMEVKCLWRVSC
eukprot:2083501-Pleurochrysis_carterae.AAC.3